MPRMDQRMTSLRCVIVAHRIDGTKKPAPDIGRRLLA